jgi:excisionase family DNA binding protein
MDAVVGLVTSAYEAGRSEAAAQQTQPEVAEKDAYTRREAAARLRMSTTSLDRLVSRGEIDSYSVGTSRRFTRVAVEAYMGTEKP